MSYAQLADGPRSTFFEYDMQIFYVSYQVAGAKVGTVELYRPYIEALSSSGSNMMVATAGPSMNGIPTIEFKPLSTIFINPLGAHMKWTRDYTPDIVDAFIEKYTPKAVIRRVA